MDTDEWEAINDNGFVYKRRKRHTGPTSLPRAPEPEPEPDLQNQLKLKKRREILLQVKDKYQKELALWDHLANSLKGFEDRVKSQVQHKDSEVQLHGPCDKGFQPVVDIEENGNGSLVQELLFKVEAQEAIIRNFEQLCDVVDSICDAQEEKAKQVFFNLPIWNSPRELMASLSED